MAIYTTGNKGRSTDWKLQQDLDWTVNALVGSTFNKKEKKKELIRNCFWRIKLQVCILVYPGLKLRPEYAKILWVGRSTKLTSSCLF